MKTIWKKQLQVTNIQTIVLPVGSQILTMQVQHGVPYLWALVSPPETPVGGKEPIPAKNEEITIYTYDTGHPCPQDKADYIGTYQVMFGDLVFHVFVGKRG